MLVLTRAIDQIINIYETIGGKPRHVASIMLCGVDAEGRAQIGIQADKNIQIYREEIDANRGSLPQMGRRERKP